jgi:cytidylate kinase
MAPQTAPRIVAPRIIAIDGPSAAGKGTLARRLAAHFSLPYLDTGLHYRAVGRRVLDAGADPADPHAALAAARALQPEDLDRGDLRGPEADEAASLVAAQQPVRDELLDFQRRFGAERGAVLDGRDIGTVVFPAADVKLFVTASPAERAHRRFLEFQAKGIPRPLAEVEAELAARDQRDTERLAAPAKKADDALVLDTTGRDADQVFAAALALIAAAGQPTAERLKPT